VLLTGTGRALPKIRVAADGRTFVTENGKPFVPFGVNYYRPDTGWAPQVWKKFDADAIRRDFVMMKSLGVNCVRVFLSYGSFFTEPNALDAAGLAKFDQFLSIAEEAGIYVHPTGPDHWEGLPTWARGDRIGDPKILATTENFWRLFAQRYRGRNVIFAYDLLNEPSVPWNPPEGADVLAYQRSREDIADEWTRRQVAAIKAVDPQALVTVGLIQWSVPALLPGVKHYSGFRPSRQAKFLDFMEIHFYPLDNKGAEPETRNLAYLESVVREVAATGKPVVVAEFSWNREGQEQQARWNRRAVELTAGLACGWLNWGLYDVAEARDGSQFTALLTVDGKPKAWAREFQQMAGTLKITPVKQEKRPSLDWDRCLSDTKAGDEFRTAYFKAMMPLDTFNYVIGTQTFSPSYQFTKEPKLIETARAILAMGSNTIKFQLKTLGPEERQVFEMPFAHYLVWAETDGLYELVCKLLKTYSGTGKTFYLGHWEGDWLLRGTGNTKDEDKVTPAKIQKMIDWLNARQRAVDDAKCDTPHHGVEVWHYTEVNLVKLAMQGKKTMCRDVLPKVPVDFVSYSCYDTQKSPEQLKAALDFIESKLHAKPGITGKRVFIGEYGFPTSPREQDRLSRQVMRVGLEWGCPFVLYWEMYNNEIDKDGKQRGFWMIDDKGVKQPIYHTHQKFYEKARRFVAERRPTAEEFARYAVTLLP
jgi:endo-1,4-beta-mannosidase